MNTRVLPALALVTLVVRVAAGAEPTSAAGRADHAVSDLDFCVARTNEYRSSIGRPALMRSAVLESYAAAAAPHDGSARAVHLYFHKTRGGGVAFAENQIPWWPLPQYGSVREVIRQGLEMMWAEGRGGGHYENIVGGYREVGCGVFVDGPRVTVVQAFR
jgi:hypothetical protein